MRIAVASEGSLVTNHFGHCTNFNLFDLEGDKIIAIESLPNPGHKPGFLPLFLYEKGVQIIISGGMGQGAIDIFKEKGIEVITGAQGSAEAAVKDYIKGNLASSYEACEEHQHNC